MPTIQEIKDQINADIRNKTAPGSVTRANVADNLDAVLDYVDQQNSILTDIDLKIVGEDDVFQITWLNQGDFPLPLVSHNISVNSESEIVVILYIAKTNWPNWADDNAVSGVSSVINKISLTNDVWLNIVYKTNSGWLNGFTSFITLQVKLIISED